MYYFLLALFLCACNKKTDFKLKDNFLPKEDRKNLVFENSSEAKKDIFDSKIDFSFKLDSDFEFILKAILRRFDLSVSFEDVEPFSKNYSAKNKKIIEILKDIAELGNYRLAISGKNIYFKQNTPYLHSHSIPLLLTKRKTKSETSFIDSNNEKSSMKTSSKSIISSDSEVDSFEELRENIENLLSHYSSQEKPIKFSIHKQAGVLNLYADQKLQLLINQYLRLISKKNKDQVEIEAKIYEVELIKSFSSGVDWNRILGRVLSKDGYQVSLPSTAPALKAGDFGLAFNTSSELSSFSGSFFELLSSFGRVESLSNPKITVANNNTGMFKVVDNKVFFKLSKSVVWSGKNDSNAIIDNVNSEIQTIPVGLVIVVQPVILNDGKVSIALKPTISEVYDEIEDPAVSFMAQQSNSSISSKIPVVKTREMDTVFTLESGKSAIIGGLIYSKKKRSSRGVPKMHIISGSKYKLSEKKEIVIIMKARVIKSKVEPLIDFFRESE